MNAGLQDDQLLRYSRHILLDEIGIEGQERILASHALIVGLGGLGSPAALYLAAAGVGRITLLDHDVVDTSNLQRQIAHTTAREGVSKALSAKAAMLAINPSIEVRALAQKADEQTLADHVKNADVVLDCTDHFATRHLINRVCVQFGKPLVSGSAVRWDGQLSVYHPRSASDRACYACVFPAEQHFEETACATLGVLGPLVGMVGSMQAMEALKILSNMGSDHIGRLLLIDGKRMSMDAISTRKASSCSVCANV